MSSKNCMSFATKNNNTLLVLIRTTAWELKIVTNAWGRDGGDTSLKTNCSFDLFNAKLFPKRPFELAKPPLSIVTSCN